MARSIRTNRHSTGFTLIELLVAIGIIALIVGISFPAITAMRNTARSAAGRTTVSVGVDIARAWSTQEKGIVNGIAFEGTAALFTPAGRIRIVQHDQGAEDSSLAEPLLGKPANGLRGYEDMPDLDYVDMPSNVGVAGIRYNGTDPQFLAAPFAVTFNQHGTLTHSPPPASDRVVYYDADRDGQHDVADPRQPGYDPAAWDGEGSGDNADELADGRLELPFEAIETVRAVLIYDKSEYPEFFASNSVLTTLPSGFSLQDAISQNRVLFFSPHSGIAIRSPE